MLSPLPRRSHEVHLPVSSSVPSAFPNRGVGRLSRLNPRTRLFAEAFFEAADIPLCLGLRVCSSPRSFLPLRILPQGSRDFYIRAQCASLPPHTPDMLAVRIQAIDGARTFTLQDSQPCRPLPPVNASRAALRLPAHDSGSGWLAMPYLYDFYIRDSTPVYPGALPNLSQLFCGEPKGIVSAQFPVCRASRPCERRLSEEERWDSFR